MTKPTGDGVFSLQCPLPLRDYPEIVLAHGAGGALTKELIDKMFAPIFDNAWLREAHDGAVFDAACERLAFTTDSYVVKPLFFPGGDIGRLAVYGTVNDLAMCGALPRHASLGLIIEEGLPIEMLWRIVQSVARGCHETGLEIATGDTKVVDRGAGDGLFINMSGVGEVVSPHLIAPSQVQAGDAVLLSGDIGRHGVAVLSAREGLEFENVVTSDCAPLHEMMLALIQAELDIHCMRDLTRGGLATALIEIAEAARLGMVVRETQVPVNGGVRGAAELLGLDPLYIANEGRFAIILPASRAAGALDILRAFPHGRDAVEIGFVTDAPATVVLETAIGARRPLDLLSGEQLPRIC